MQVSALYIYPIKSCGGIEVSSLPLDRLGPLHDRRFMLVDPDGQFVTQRALPKLCLVSVQLAEEQLLLEAPGMAPLAVSLARNAAAVREVRVWRHTGPAEDAGDEAAAWFSSLVGQALRLVRFPEQGERRVNPDYAPGNHHTAFTDGYPILLIGQASLDDLNGRLSQPVPMNRFRPNLVISGCAPFAEDGFRRIRVGELVLEVVKPCERCTVTTIDQRTAVGSKEPLKTLAGYRTVENKVMFGQNCVAEGTGTLRVGDTVQLLA